MSELLIESEDTYHGQAGENLSSHLLALFRDCPEGYRRVISGEYKRPDKDYYIIGRAVHCLVLEGAEEYRKRYTSDFPVNPTTGKPYGAASLKYKEWEEEAVLFGLQPISIVNGRLVEAMAASVEHHNEAMELLIRAPHRECVIREQYMGMPCQIRMDAMGEEVGIVDYKTCDRIGRFPYAAGDYGYYNQLAFYRKVLKLSGLANCLDVWIIATEKQWLYRTGVWKVSREDLDCAEVDNEFEINALKECQTSGIWPTNYEDIRVLGQHRG